MPIIKDYECPKCGWTLEVWHAEDTKHEPPVCPCGTKAERVYTPLNFNLRGFGWARDGYSKDIDDMEAFWKKEGKPVAG